MFRLLRVSRLLGAVMAAGLLLSACAQAATAPPATATRAAPTRIVPVATITVPAPPPTSSTAALTEAANARLTATAAANASIIAAATANVGIPATNFLLPGPWGVAVDASGQLFVTTCADSDFALLLQIDLSGKLKVFSGLNYGFGGDGGPAILAKFYCPSGIAFDQAGNLYVADQGNNRIRRIDKNGTIRTVAGSGAGGTVVDFCCVGGFGGDGGPATAANLWNPVDIAFDLQGNLYIGDRNNFRVRKVDQQGVITTIAGIGTAGFSGDGGAATAAQFNTAPSNYVPMLNQHQQFGLGFGMSIAVDADGNLYVTDIGNARVRKVDTQGIVTTIAGTGKAGYSGDGGPATAAQLSAPVSLAFDAEGNLYFADGPSDALDGNRIRKIDKTGIITTVAGTGEAGFSGDGGPATAALLRQPGSIAFDAQGNLYFADYGNNRVRMVDKEGIITTVVG